MKEDNIDKEKLEAELLQIKTKVDSVGYAEFAFANELHLCEIEKIRDKYNISFYIGIEESELLKTYKMKDFPNSDWFEAKAKSVIMTNFYSSFGLF